MVSLYKLNKSSSNEIKIIIEKQIVFQSSNLNISYFVNQKRQDSKMLGLKQLTYPLDMIEIANTVQLFDNQLICQGGPSVINFPGIYAYLKYFGNNNNYYLFLYIIHYYIIL